MTAVHADGCNLLPGLATWSLPSCYQHCNFEGQLLHIAMPIPRQHCNFEGQLPQTAAFLVTCTMHMHPEVHMHLEVAMS